MRVSHVRAHKVFGRRKFNGINVTDVIRVNLGSGVTRVITRVSVKRIFVTSKVRRFQVIPRRTRTSATVSGRRRHGVNHAQLFLAPA